MGDKFRCSRWRECSHITCHHYKPHEVHCGCGSSTYCTHEKTDVLCYNVTDEIEQAKKEVLQPDPMMALEDAFGPKLQNGDHVSKALERMEKIYSMMTLNLAESADIRNEVRKMRDDVAEAISHEKIMTAEEMENAKPYLNHGLINHFLDFCKKEDEREKNLELLRAKPEEPTLNGMTISDLIKLDEEAESRSIGWPHFERPLPSVDRRIVEKSEEEDTFMDVPAERLQDLFIAEQRVKGFFKKVTKSLSYHLSGVWTEQQLEELQKEGVILKPCEYKKIIDQVDKMSNSIYGVGEK